MGADEGACAKEAGRQTSPYIVGRVLKRDGLGDEETGRGHALVLDEGQQREMHDAALGAEAAISQLFGLSDTSSPGLHEIVAMLFEARLDELARTGRQDEMEALLSSDHRPGARRGYRPPGLGAAPDKDR